MSPQRSDCSAEIAAPSFFRVDLYVLVVSAVILIFFRFHAFDLPLETDECNYAYIGARLLAGDALYVDLWDHQPPGVFMLFAGVIALFGDGVIVFRLLATAASLVTLVAVYFVARNVTRDDQSRGRVAAIVAANLFALVSSDPGTGGEGCNREIFMNALIAGAWAFAAWGGARRYSKLAVSGALLGAASVLKTVVAVHWLALLIAVVFGGSRGSGRADRSNWSGDRAARNSAWKAVILFGAGPAAIWLAVFAYFAATGRFNEFYEAVFAFNVGYSGGGDGGFLQRFILFFAPPRHPFVFDSAITLWIMAASSTLWLIWRTIKHDCAAPLVLAWLLGSYAAACLPARFWPHYYYLLIPPACIASAVLVARVCILIHERTRRGALRWIPALIALLAVVHVEVRSYLSQPLFGITVNRYNSRDFWGRAQGENVARVTAPDDRVFVYGNDAEIYYYSGRRCASRYTMITGIGQGMARADQRRKILMDELRSDPPRVIVVLFDEQPFPQWKQFLDEFYGEPVGWDFHDKTRKPIMFVLARKDRPIESIDWDWDRKSVGGW